MLRTGARTHNAISIGMSVMSVKQLSSFCKKILVLGLMVLNDLMAGKTKLCVVESSIYLTSFLNAASCALVAASATVPEHNKQNR